MKLRLAVFYTLLVAAGTLLWQQRFILQARPAAETAKAKLRPSWGYYPGRVLIKFKPEVTNFAEARLRASLSPHGILKWRPLFAHARDQFAAQNHPGLGRIVLAEVSPQTDLEALAAQLQRSPLVEYAEPDYLIPLDGLPNDSLYFRQQYLPQIKAPEAWETARGDSNVIIAIIDSGTDWQHPDLAANIWKNPGELIDGLDNDGNGFIDDVRGWDFVDNPPDPYPGEDAAIPDNDPMDFAGHGTGVAGVAAAVTDNGAGIAALSWNVKIMPLRVGWLRIDGISLVDAAWTAAAFVYAADNGAHVANLSAGSTRVVAEAAAYAFEKGVTITSAAGNNSNEEAYGLNLAPFTITVAAVNEQDEYTSYTSYGDWVKVCAPGGDTKRQSPGLLTTFLQHDYAELQGTSFAAPLAAALAALVKSQHRDWSPAQITFQVVETADNIDARNPDYLQGKLGRGRINARRALTETIAAAPQISFVKTLLDDAAGNGDGVWDAGETIQLAIELRNDWGDAVNLAAAISSQDYAVRIIKNTSNYGTLPGISDLPARAKSNAHDPFLITAMPEALPHRAHFKLDLRAEGGYQKSFEFHLALTPAILLVDDDGGKINIENFYTEILDSLGLGFDTFTHAEAELEPGLLQKYATVIWACEWIFPSLNENDRAELQKYLQAGGNLFLSGQDIGWDLCDPAPGYPNEFNLSGGASKTFYEQFLRARYLRDDGNALQVSGVAGDPISDGLSFNIKQPERTVSEQLPSEIAPLANATSIFTYPNGQTGAVRAAGDHRLVYFAFGGYEAIVPKPQRERVMPRVLNWLNGFHLEHTPLRDSDDTTRSRRVTARIVSEISPLQRLELHWDTDGELPFNKTEMIPAGNGEYSAEIPPQFRKTVEYFFFARTQRGFTAPLQKFSYATLPDTIPPALENLLQLPNTLNNAGPYFVSVEALDASGIDSNNVKIHFHARSGRQGFIFLQASAPQPGRFEGGIPGGWAYGDTVFYRASANDLALRRNAAFTSEKFFVVGLSDFEEGLLREWAADSSGSPPSAWGVTAIRAYNGRYAANSNPGRGYSLKSRSAMTLSLPLDFSRVIGLRQAHLSFAEQHYFADGQQDYGVAEISSDGGQNWEALQEFRGLQTQWQVKRYDLGRFAGTNDVRLRFRLATDSLPHAPLPGWFIDEVRVYETDAVAVREREEISHGPKDFALRQNHPNPLSSSRAPANVTTVRFDLPEPAEVNLSIYDVLGRRIATLVNEKQNAGVHLVQWHGKDEAGRRVAPGIYLYRMQALSRDAGKTFQATRKMMVMP